MSSVFSAVGEAPVAALKTVLLLVGAATLRPKLEDLLISYETTPADVQTKFHLSRSTDLGTSTPVTPTKLTDPEGRSPTSTAGEAHSVEPTYGDDLLKFSVHQRQSYRWVPRPGHEIPIPAVALNGLGLNAVISDAVPTANATFLFTE